MDTRKRHEVSLELGKVDVESTIETETGGDGTDDLGNQTVEMLVAGPGDVEVATANIIDGLVVDEKGAVGVLDGAVGGQDGIVGLDNGSGHAGSRVDREFELGLFTILGGETLEEQGTKAGTGTTTKRVEDQEALQRGTVVWIVSSLHVYQRWETYRQRDGYGQ